MTLKQVVSKRIAELEIVYRLQKKDKQSVLNTINNLKRFEVSL